MIGHITFFGLRFQILAAADPVGKDGQTLRRGPSKQHSLKKQFFYFLLLLLFFYIGLYYVLALLTLTKDKQFPTFRCRLPSIFQLTKNLVFKLLALKLHISKCGLFSEDIFTLAPPSNKMFEIIVPQLFNLIQRVG